MTNLDRAVNDAIFTLQLSTTDAVRYVVKHTGVNTKDASDSIKQAVVWYKK